MSTTINLIRYYAKFLNNTKPAFVNKDISNIDPSKLGLCCGLDVETTDLLIPKVEITELGLRQYVYHKETFELLQEKLVYNEHNEPSDLSKITEQITKLTGIDADKVKGKKIDWDYVKKIINESDYIIAHNAKFDKSHVEEFIGKKKWLCSCHGVDWSHKEKDGFTPENKKLEILCLHFGEFTYEGHRADVDVDAMMTLVQKTNVLKEMFENSSKKTVVVKGYLDGYQKSDVKNIVTKKDNELGVTLSLKSEVVDGKKVYWHEAMNLTDEQVATFAKKLRELVKKHDANIEKKLEIYAEEQNV
jgi:DNA polymerase-3 subunit epsilon